MVVFSFYASAENVFIDCSDCFSPIEFEYTARAQSLVEGTSYIYVANLGSGVLKKFYHKYIPGNPQYGEPAVYITKPVTLDNTSASNFQEILQARSDIAELLDTIKDVPASVTDSAWKLPGNDLVRRQVANYYRDNQSLRQLVGNYTAMLFTLGGKLISAKLYVTVHFSDNSMARYQIVGIDENGQLEFQFLSAQDDLGNNIPSGIAQMEGSFKFNGQGWSRYNSIALAFGITARFEGNVPTGTAEIIDCYSEKGSDGKMKITCNKSNKP